MVLVAVDAVNQQPVRLGGEAAIADKIPPVAPGVGEVAEYLPAVGGVEAAAPFGGGVGLR